MSSRARKKLAKQTDILSDLAKDLEEDEGSLGDITFSKKKGKNLNSFDVVKPSRISWNESDQFWIIFRSIPKL